MRLHPIARWALPLLLLGCEATTPTQVMVIVDASDALEARAARLVVSVFSEEGELVYRANHALGVDLDLPGYYPVVPRDGDAGRRFTVEAALLDEDGATVSRARVTEGFEADTLREVQVALPDELRCTPEPALSLDVPELSGRLAGANPVPDSTLRIETEPGETWLVFMTGQLSARGNTFRNRLTVLVDGSVDNYAESAGRRGQSVQTLSVIAGDGAPHEISLSLDIAMEEDVTLSDVHLYATRVPPFADLHLERLPGEQRVQADARTTAQLVFEPVYPGEYVVFASAGISERPDGSGVRLHLETPQGQFPRGGEDFSSGRSPVLPILLARTERLGEGPAVFSLQGRSAMDRVASIHNPTIVALRADALCAVRSLLESEDLRSGMSATATLPALELDAPTVGTRWLTISDAMVTAPLASNDDTSTSMGFRRDGAPVATRDQQHVNGGGTVVTVAHIDLFEADTAMTLDATLTPDAEADDGIAREWSVLAIRL